MNYFAHFFVDHKTQQHEYNAGLFLPDVARGFVSSFRPPLPENASLPNRKFWEGCQAHYRADKIFHGSSLFQTLLDTTNQLVNSAAFSNELNRKWFLAHIMSELMLDRILIKDDSRYLDMFYDSLSSINDDDLADFLRMYHIQNEEVFLEHFNHFRKVKYIYYYTDNNKFVYSLNRIMIRAGVGAMSEQDQQLLLSLVDELEQQFCSLYPQLGASLKAIHNI